MEPARLEELKRLLIAERERLTAGLGSFATKDPNIRDDWDTRYPSGTEPAALSHSAQEEQADIREAYESELAQEHSMELRLREVHAALQRIREHTYGRCLQCREEISEDRLSANPAAAYDMAHQPRE